MHDNMQADRTRRLRWTQDRTSSPGEDTAAGAHALQSSVVALPLSPHLYFFSPCALPSPSSRRIGSRQLWMPPRRYLAMATSPSATGAAVATADDKLWASIWSAGTTPAVVAMSTAALDFLLTIPLLYSVREGANAAGVAAIEHILLRNSPPQAAAGIAATLVGLFGDVVAGSVGAVASIGISATVLAVRVVGIAAWTAAGTASTEAGAGVTLLPTNSFRGGSVVTDHDGGGDGRAGGWRRTGVPRPSHGYGAAPDRRWLGAVFGAHAVALCGITACFSWSLNEPHRWWNTLLGVATFGMEFGVLVALCRRVVLPASMIPEGELIQTVESAAGVGRPCRSAPVPDSLSVRSVHMSSAVRRHTRDMALIAVAICSAYAAPGMFLLALVGVLICLPTATPWSVVVVVMGVGGLGGVILFVDTVRGHIVVARARRERQRAGREGGG